MDWNVTVCSGLLCLDEPIGEQEINVSKGKTEPFKITFAMLEDIAGTGSLWLNCWSKKDPTIKDSIYLELTTRDLVSIKNVKENAFKVYPNPTTDKVTVTLKKWWNRDHTGIRYTWQQAHYQNNSFWGYYRHF